MMAQFDVKCHVCGESGSPRRMDLDKTGKCFYCREEDKETARLRRELLVTLMQLGAN